VPSDLKAVAYLQVSGPTLMAKDGARIMPALMKLCESEKAS
jgi:hypothetical protein